MSEDQSKKIIADHPKLFAHCNYFECGPGWFDIIEKLADQLEPLVSESNDDENSFYASQVKEKYGSLRFYMSLSNSIMADLIDKAEQESEKTCEVCGKEGRRRGTSWIYTRCDECWAHNK